MNRFVQLDQYNFYQQMEEMSGIALIFFTSPNCGSCHAMRAALEQLQTQHPKVTVTEIDAADNAGLTNAFGFFHLPALYLYLDGQFHCEIDTVAMPQAILDAIEAARLQPASEEP